MNKLRLAIAALSVFAIAGLTACDNDKNNAQPAKSVSPKKNDDGKKDGDKVDTKALQAKIDAKNATLKSVQELANSSYGEDKCSAEEYEVYSASKSDSTGPKSGENNGASAAIKNIASQKIISENGGATFMQTQVDLLVSLSDNKYCQVNALSAAAQKAMGNYIGASSNDLQPLSTEEEAAHMSHFSLINTVLGAELTKTKGLLDRKDALQAASENYQKALKGMDHVINLTGNQIQTIEEDTAECGVSLSCTSGVQYIIGYAKDAKERRAKIVQELQDLKDFEIAGVKLNVSFLQESEEMVNRRAEMDAMQAELKKRIVFLQKEMKNQKKKTYDLQAD